jgi:hypothetical protein
MMLTGNRGYCVAGVVCLGLALAPSVRPATAKDDKNGAVTISSKFPGGNVLVEKNEGGAVRVAPDLRGDNPWFYWYFEATATQPGRVNFAFPEKVAGVKNGAIGHQGPAISTDDGKTWRWMGTETVTENAFYYDFTKTGERARFAVAIPYLQSDLEKFLEANAKNKHLKVSVLTKSRKGRAVELLQIGEPGPGRKAVLVTGRHHAAETIASYVLEGYLQAAMSDDAAGKAFREQYVLFAVPFVDKDGVEDGDQGKNRKPHDHNRDYGEKSIYPEVQAIRELDKTHDFRLTLDFHCPMLTLEDHQVMHFVGAKDHPAANFDNINELAKQIKTRLPKDAPAGPLNWLRPADKPVPMNSHYFGFKKGQVMAATLEFPFAPKGKATDPASCRKYGQIILSAFVETRFITAEPKK